VLDLGLAHELDVGKVAVVLRALDQLADLREAERVPRLAAKLLARADHAVERALAHERAGPRGRRRDEGAGACAEQSSDDGPHLLK
jgi:hypothetical protein